MLEKINYYYNIEIKGNTDVKNYFKNDEYWKKRINEKLEIDMWIDEYIEYFNNKGKCLELGCGIGQYSKRLMEYGYEVTSTDISETALREVKKFNKNTKIVDMTERLPFESETFDLVFASLSIHYFDDKTTKQLVSEIKRVLKNDGVFIGSVNGKEALEVIKETAVKLEDNFYLNKDRYIRLFDKEEIKKYLSIFQVQLIDKRETIRFSHKKNYYIFIAKKQL